jgi:hypothetical protein
MAEEFPVTIAVERGGRTEEVRVGTAVRSGDGFVLRLHELRVHAAAAEQPAWRAAQGGAPTSAAPSGGGAPSPFGGAQAFPNYGRSKGQPIAGASLQDLEYYARGCRRTLADPNKARFHDKERVLLAAIEAEITRQQGMPAMDPSTAGEPLDEGPPPLPPDEETPF